MQVISLLNKGDIRSVKAKKNIAASFVIKGLDILIGFILVPVTLNYLGRTKFGVWQTIASLVSWLMFFDIGLGNGLRNKYVEAKAKKKIKLIKYYISTSYYALAIISLVIITLTFIISNFINWQKIYNATTLSNFELKSLSEISISLFSLYLILRLIEAIFLGEQLPALKDFFLFLSKILILIFVFVISQISHASLILIALIYRGIPVIVLLGVSYYFYCFSQKYKLFKPELKYFNVKYLKDVGSLGVKFFIIQISVVVLFTSGNIIVAQLFGAKEVTPFSISYKYFTIPIMGFSIIMTPFWSAITEAYAKGEMIWIKKTILKLIYVWGFVLFSATMLYIFSDKLIYFWLKKDFGSNKMLLFGWYLFAVLQTLNMIFTFFLNGVGKIYIQLLTATFSIFVHIPFAVFLAKYMHLGVAGVVFSIDTMITIYIIFRSYQVYLIITSKARGYWLK